MKSTKNEYRIVTAYNGKYSYQSRSLDSEHWTSGWADYDSIGLVKERINYRIAEDNFKPEVIDA